MRLLKMDFHGVKRLDRSSGYGIASVSAGFGGKPGEGFRDNLGNQMKDDFRKRIKGLLDEMTELAPYIADRMDITLFERYRGQMKELLSEIVKNTYRFNSEYVMELNGRQRVFTTLGVVDNMLDDLAKDLLEQNQDKLDYLSRIDEIRGLIMDVLL